MVVAGRVASRLATPQQECARRKTPGDCGRGSEPVTFQVVCDGAADDVLARAADLERDADGDVSFDTWLTVDSVGDVVAHAGSRRLGVVASHDRLGELRDLVLDHAGKRRHLWGDTVVTPETGEVRVNVLLTDDTPPCR